MDKESSADRYQRRAEWPKGTVTFCNSPSESGLARPLWARFLTCSVGCYLFHSLDQKLKTTRKKEFLLRSNFYHYLQRAYGFQRPWVRTPGQGDLSVT